MADEKCYWLVEIAKQKVSEIGLAEQFNGFHVLNATHLDGIPNETFDSSLMLGPLYHLQKRRSEYPQLRNYIV